MVFAGWTNRIMTNLQQLKELGWAKNRKFEKYSKELHRFLIDNCICGMDCPPGKLGECCTGCKDLTPDGCKLPRRDRPFLCLAAMCRYAYRRLVND